MGRKYDVVVVSAGLGGLSAATLLACRGLGVLLLERHNGYSHPCVSDPLEDLRLMLPG